MGWCNGMGNGMGNEMGNAVRNGLESCLVMEVSVGGEQLSVRVADAHLNTLPHHLGGQVGCAAVKLGWECSE